MKTLLAPQLSLLTATHPWLPGWELPQQHRNDNRDILGMGLLIGFSLTDAQAPLLLAGELWELVDKALPEGEVLDIGFPKPRGEFLVYGACHSPCETRACEVCATCGLLSKRLLVYGDRIWKSSMTSAPLPFTRMPIDWSHSFGGAAFDDNPLGKGIAPSEEGVVPLPNVENEANLVSSPSDRPHPAGFAAIPAHWPQRSRLYGTPDRNWLADFWPGVPPDHSPEYACCAPVDQQLPMGVFFTGNEALAIHNMHPAMECIQGSLPGLRCRLFLQRSSGDFEEVSTRPETLWLFPEHEFGVLLFRGVSQTRGEDLRDIATLVANIEDLAQPPKPAQAYRDWCQHQEEQQTPPEILSPPAYSEESPAPSPEPAPEAGSGAAVAGSVAAAAGLSALAAEAAAENAPTVDLASLEATVAGIRSEVDRHLAGLGIDKTEVEARMAELLEEHGLAGTGQTPPGGELESLQNLVSEMEANAKETITKLRGEGTPESLQEFLNKHMQPAPEPGEEPSAAVRKLLEQPDLNHEIREGLEQSLKGWMQFSAAMKALSMLEEQYRKTSGMDGEPSSEQPASDTKPPLEPKRLDVEQAMELIRKGRSLAGYDLGGCDFSGQDLRSSDMRGAFLLGASFAGANLEAADLRDAFCQDCDMTGASLERTDFSGATLENASLLSVKAKGALFRNAQLHSATLQGATLQGADLAEADCSDAVLDHADLTGCRARNLRLNGASMKNIVFDDANLAGCRMDAGSDATGARFIGANMAGALMCGARLDKADFHHATLDKADCCGASCRKSSLRMASAKGCDFSHADLHQADFYGLNLFKGSLRSADCSEANIRNANLFGVDVYRAHLNTEAISQSNLGRTLLAPGLLDEDKGAQP